MPLTSSLLKLVQASALAALLARCSTNAPCDGGPCKGGTTIALRLALSRATLDAAALAVCRRAACASRGDAVATNLSARGASAFALAGALAGTATIETIDATTSRLTLAIDDPSAQQTDGDTYTIALTDAASKATLFTFDRRVTAYARDPVASNCAARCSSASLRVYPGSTSGLSCTANTCASGLTLAGRAPVAGHDLVGATFHACRNGACSESTLNGVVPTQSGNAGVFTVVGPVDATVTLTLGGDGVFGVRVALAADPADLNDGDAYDVRLLNPDGGTILSLAAPITYDESFPNGPSCDTIPCRAAEATLLPPAP